MTRRVARLAILVAAAAIALTPGPAAAFCGFYIDTGGGDMFADATQVVLMRDGTRTVMSMQNTYQGPLQDFALVIPVPTVLKKGDVKTLPKSLFQKVNAMGAPRLVEYWEVDPCWIPEAQSIDARSFSQHAKEDPKNYGVKIESQFDVDEYKIIILSAKDSTGLDAYLRASHYKIPEGAAPLLRPYVETGSKFFVAKVDPKKVKFENGRAVLSPLRVVYDSEELTLPIRLGLANSAGVQDLIVSILAPARYDVANYPNAFVPTNIDVKDEVRTQFGEFYAALFDRTVQQHPGAVITEYAWNARGCDPCPGPALADEDFIALGEDTFPKLPVPPPPPPRPPPPPPKPGDEPEIDMENEIEIEEGPPVREFVLTRLHARYGATGAPKDLVFRVAAPIEGGGERRYSSADKPGLDRGARSSSTNRFQARYIIRHPWTKPMACEKPRRGMWGANPDGEPHQWSRRRIALTAAVDAASAPRGKLALHELVAMDIPELAIQQGVPLVPPLPGPPPLRTRNHKGCGCRTTDAGTSLLAALLVLFAIQRRRPRARRLSES